MNQANYRLSLPFTAVPAAGESLYGHGSGRREPGTLFLCPRVLQTGHGHLTQILILKG